MRELVINKIIEGTLDHGLDEWTSALRDFPLDETIHAEATAIRDRGDRNELRMFLEQRTDEQLLGMYTQQDCQNFR